MSSMCSSWRRYSCSIACQTSLSDVSSVSLREYMAAGTPDETQYYPTTGCGSSQARRRESYDAAAAQEVLKRLWPLCELQWLCELRWLCERRLLLADRVDEVVEVVLGDLEPEILVLAELVPWAV